MREREQDWATYEHEEWEIIFKVADGMLDDLFFDTVRSLTAGAHEHILPAGMYKAHKQQNKQNTKVL